MRFGNTDGNVPPICGFPAKLKLRLLCSDGFSDYRFPDRRRADMFGPDAKTYEPRGQASQDREPVQQPHWKRWLWVLLRREHARHDVVLDRHLKVLRHARGKLTALLHALEIVERWRATNEGRRENIRGRHR